MRAEIDELPDREKLVLSLYYDEGLTLMQISRVLGLSESRVNQIHARSVLHLRVRLAAAGVEVEGPDEHPWGREAAFSDPDGNAFVLAEPPTGGA